MAFLDNIVLKKSAARARRELPVCDLSIDLNLLYKMAFSDNIVKKNPAARAYKVSQG